MLRHLQVPAHGGISSARQVQPSLPRSLSHGIGSSTPTEMSPVLHDSLSPATSPALPTATSTALPRRLSHGLRSDCLSPTQKSHAIRSPDLSSTPNKHCNSNDPISQLERGGGTCMRHCWETPPVVPAVIKIHLIRQYVHQCATRQHAIRLPRVKPDAREPHQLRTTIVGMPQLETRGQVPRTRWSKSHSPPNAGPLFRAWAAMPAYGTDGPPRHADTIPTVNLSRCKPPLHLIGRHNGTHDENSTRCFAVELMRLTWIIVHGEQRYRCAA